MEQLPNPESDDQKVIRIARELGIGLEGAAVICDAFHLALSDDGVRRAIFEMIDELDESAARKGEPLGLIITYAVELGMDGIRVGRYADEIPAGEIVELTPAHRAMILLRINDNFPTQEFLGPLIVNRPGWHLDTFDPDKEIAEDYLPFRSTREIICLGPIRLKFNERFPCVSATKSSSQLPAFQAGMPALQSKALNPHHHLPPWAALQAGMPAFHLSSGLSPPPAIGERDTPLRKMSSGHWQENVETCVSHLDL